MVRGTRNLLGAEADALAAAIAKLEAWAQRNGFQRFIPSALVEAELFTGQVGDNRTFNFTDLGGRSLMLLPEVTGVVRREYRETWSRALPKPVSLYYTARCYRYDRPQRGRYREFTQFGIEQLPARLDMLELLRDCLRGRREIEFRAGVKRGLAYYNADGFEAWAGGLQIAGGGAYAEGAGFAIGVERLLLVDQNG